MSLLNKVLNSKHMPDRAALAGGLAGIVAFLLSSFTGLNANEAMAFVMASIVIVNHFTPESVKDLARKGDTIIKDNAGNITDILIKVGGASGNEQVVVQPSVGKEGTM